MVEVPVKMYVTNLAKKARESARAMALLSSPTKEKALIAMADRLEAEEEKIIEANRQDLDMLGKTLDKEAAKAAVERIRLSTETVKEMVEGVRRVAELPDPVGEITSLSQRPNGMQVSRVRVPIGVIGIISELGPLVMTDVVALCLKSGNVSIYWGNAEWSRTTSAIAALLCEAAEAVGVPAGAINVMERTEREIALELMRQTQYLNALIPRGGAGLRKAAFEQSKLPILCHDGGVCYIYIDADADLPMAQNIVINSKVQQPTALNAVDTLLVHQGIARTLLPALVRRLLDEFKVDILGCPKTIALTGSQQLTGYKAVLPAKEEDWGRKFQAPALAVKMVTDMDEALEHLARYGPGQTATIITRDYDRAMRFAREVDSSAVLVNASTRLHDGEQFGLGREVGISTMRTHARGPIGLEQLTIEKYVVLGTGQLRQPHPVPVTYEDAIMLKRPLG